MVGPKISLKKMTLGSKMFFGPKMFLGPATNKEHKVRSDVDNLLKMATKKQHNSWYNYPKLESTWNRHGGHIS